MVDSRFVLAARTMERKVNKVKIREQIDFLVNRALDGGRGNGWNWEHQIGDPQIGDAGWDWTVTLQFYKGSGNRDPQTVDSQWHKIYNKLCEVSQNARFGTRPWKVVGSDVEDITPEPKEEAVIGTVSLERGNFFDELYGLGSQIEIVLSAIRAGQQSEWKNRFHCILFGSAACGKTSCLEGVKKMLGPENQSYLAFDATAMTSAGIARVLLDSTYLPPVLIVEEIEKTSENDLRWLLGVLDHRGEIRRTNARIGNRQKSTPMLCLATANNIELFKKVMSGALASRFSHEVYFPRPSREILSKILEREIKKVNGKMEWIEPTLEWAYNRTTPIDDPRKIVPVALCGGDKLLTGEYQQFLDDVAAPFPS